jgi:alpha-L-fucosidase
MEKQTYYPESDPLVLNKLEQWQDLKFGLLMHWGTYSQWGIIESWSICGEDEEWIKRFRNNDNYEQYKRDYENLQTTFNPVKFKPEKWAKAAKRAGMKYMVFTTKHHDGFAMFDTQFSDYKITGTKTPFHTHPKANVTKVLFDTFRQEGFWIGAYFSKPDWHSPYFWTPDNATADRNPNYSIERYSERWEKFVQYTHNQINELMTDYGKVDILWLDGGWVQPYTEQQLWAYRAQKGFKQFNLQSQDLRMGELVEKARTKQPGLIVVDRAVEGPYQNYITPENRVPEKAVLVPWESCMTGSIDGWSWREIRQYKSTRQIIHTLVDIVSKGGNLLLNIAPDPTGEFDEEAYKLLDEVGEWMDVNSEAIYETRAVKPYKEGKVALTQNRHTKDIYAIYLAEENEKSIPSKIWLSSITPDEHAKVYLLGKSGELKWEKVGNGFVVNIPEAWQKKAPCNYAWVLKIVNP